MFRPVKGTATKIFASVLCSVFLQKKKETDIEIISFPIKSSGIESVAHQNFICFTKKKKKKKKSLVYVFFLRFSNFWHALHSLLHSKSIKSGVQPPIFPVEI